VARGPGPGLANARVQAEVADELARAAQATDVADRRDERARGDRADARDSHQPQHLGLAQRLTGDRCVQCRDLRIEEVDVPQAPGDRLALVGGQLQLRQPPATTHANTSVTGGRPCKRRISTAWISFFARVRARTS
jgi:hypothetical protein